MVELQHENQLIVRRTRLSMRKPREVNAAEYQKVLLRIVRAFGKMRS